MPRHSPGDILFEETIPGATRDRLRLFSQATQDPNPIHVDEAFAKECGFPTVVQQGPMTTAHFARLLEAAVGRDRLKLLDVTFTAPVFPGDALTLTASISEVGNGVVRCDLRAVKEDGAQTAKGFAEFEDYAEDRRQ